MFGKDFVTTAGAVSAAISGTSATVSSSLVAGKSYIFCANTACWIKQGTGAQTAMASAANNVLVPAGIRVPVHGSNGDTLSVIQDASPGSCSLSLSTEL